MQNFIISKEDSGQTAIKYLNRIFKDAPQGLLYKQIRKKNITLNSVKMTGSEKIKEGDVIAVFMSDETIAKFSGKAVKDVSEYLNAYKTLEPLDIVYEDSHVIIADKPVGILSQKSRPEDLSANEWLIGYLLEKKAVSLDSLSTFTPSVCNRLDRNTGGLIIFGKSAFGSVRMNSLIRERKVRKFYKTIVCGEITSSKDEHLYLSKDEKNNKVTVSSEKIPGYDEIHTSYVPLRLNKDGNLSELEVELFTGKPHQIRAHLAYLNHPVLGDSKYGNSKMNSKYKTFTQILYAYRLIFPVMDDYPELSSKTIEKTFDSIFDKYMMR